jgi:colanic acid/amylovoran biosynthesis protein
MGKEISQITITNVFGYYNKGDAAIFKSQKEMLNKSHPNAIISATSRFPDLEEKHHKDVKFYELLMSSTDENRLKRKLLLLRNLLGLLCVNYVSETIGRLILPRNKISSLEVIKNSDVIYGCGGGYLHDSTYSFLPPLLELKYAQKHQKKVVLMGQTIGPFRTKIGRFFAKKIINDCTKLLVREEWSEEYLTKELNISNELIELIPDLAFSLEKINEEAATVLLRKEGVDTNRPIVGMTVRDWHFPGFSNADEKLENYLLSITKLINYLTESLNYQVILFPQVISPDAEDDDRNTSRKIFEKVIRKENVFAFVNDYDPTQLKGMISMCRVFIGTRMHSNIFALGSRVPTIAISYLPKTDGIMQMVNQKAYVKSINDVSYEWLHERFDNIIINEVKIRDEIDLNVKEIEKQLEQLVDAIAKS